MNIQERQALVRDFHRKSGEPINDAPEPPDDTQAVLRAKFILEEAFELVEALGVRVIHRVCVDREIRTDDGFAADILDFELLRLEPTSRQPDLVAAVDALRDLEYQIHGTELVLGVHAATDETFLEVHRSNMEKQIVDSSPDGKAVKPRGWKPPNIAGALRKAFPKKALLFRK